MHAIQGVGFAENATDAEPLVARILLTEMQSAWRDVSPGVGAYLGEGDREEEEFQQSFYGDMHERLSEIKRAVDPWDVFWAKTAVGSERWEVRTSDVIGMRMECCVGLELRSVVLELIQVLLASMPENGCIFQF
jgi:hypothetical protein